MRDNLWHQCHLDLALHNGLVTQLGSWYSKLPLNLLAWAAMWDGRWCHCWLFSSLVLCKPCKCMMCQPVIFLLSWWLHFSLFFSDTSSMSVSEWSHLAKTTWTALAMVGLTTSCHFCPKNESLAAADKWYWQLLRRSANSLHSTYFTSVR